MTEQDETPGLLRLPREIRDEIFSHLLYEHNEPPPNPSFPGVRISDYGFQCPYHRLEMPSATGIYAIKYLETPLQHGYAGLLRANRQLRDELLELVNHTVASGQSTAELDLMFKGYQSWPTWVQCPLFLRPASKAWVEQNPITNAGVYSFVPANLNVNVNLRIFSTEGFHRNGGWPIQPGNGSGIKDLLTLLLRFAEFGPDFGHHASNYGGMFRSLRSKSDSCQSIDEHGNTRSIYQGGGCKIYRINTLTVNVTFEDIYSRATHPETAHQIFKALKELALSGLFIRGLKIVRARAKFMQDGKEVEWANEWERSVGPNLGILMRWKIERLIRMKDGKHNIF